MFRLTVQTVKPTKNFVRHFAQPKTNAGWSEAKSNMVNGDLQASSGVGLGTDKINNTPFLGPESKAGRDRNRKNMADTEEFPKNDVGSVYSKDNNLVGNKKDNDAQMDKGRRWDSNNKGRDLSQENTTVGAQFKDEDQLIQTFGKEGYSENGFTESELAAIRKSAMGDKDNNIDFYGIKQVEDQFARQQAEAAKKEQEKVDQTKYSSKWGQELGQKESKWNKDAEEATKYADSTVNSQSESYTDAILGTVKSTLKDVSDSVTSTVTSTVLPAAQNLGNVMAKTLDGKGLGNAVSGAAEKAKGGMEVLKSGVSGAADMVKESVAYAAEAIPPMASNLKNKAEEIVGASSAQLKEKAESVYEKAKDTVQSSINGTKKGSESQGYGAASKDKEQAYSASKADAKDMEMEDTSFQKSGQNKKF